MPLAADAADRSRLLHEMDQRHDALLDELNELNRRIEEALGALRPAAADNATTKTSRRDAQSPRSDED
jgi:hypothetical protein